MTAPGGGIPGLPGYDPNANIGAIGGNNAPMQGGAPAGPMGAALGPSSGNPNWADGLSGSEIFARLFGQQGPRP